MEKVYRYYEIVYRYYEIPSSEDFHRVRIDPVLQNNLINPF